MKILFICYDMVYHRIYFKYIIIVFYIFTIFLNKTNDQTCAAEIEECLYSKMMCR
jgi:hypothetical protein